MIDKERRTMPKGVEWPVVDGEPVVPGDVLWDESGNRREVRSVNFITVGCAYLNMEDGTSWMGGMDSFTRTEPPKPLLDRDGVPIEVGDTVYLVNLDFPMEVHDIHDGPGSYHTVECITEPGHTVGYDPGRLTHEAPDSWERLEEDAGKGACDYFGSEYCECGGCPHEMDPDCNVVVAMDIVRRAKALAGGGDRLCRPSLPQDEHPGLRGIQPRRLRSVARPGGLPRLRQRVHGPGGVRGGGVQGEAGVDGGQRQGSQGRREDLRAGAVRR